MNKKYIVALVAVLIIATWVGVSFPKTPTNISVDKIVSEVKARLNLGAVAGPDVDAHMFLNSGATMGGYIATSSTAATYTTSANDLKGLPTVVLWTPNLNTTISLASTTFLGYVPKIGDVANIYFRNASSTAAASITFAALNTNVDLQFAEATGGDLVLIGLDWAKLTVIHTSNNLITVIFDEFTEAD